MTSIEEIEEYIKPFLLSEITFSLEGKKIKSGKLILFSARDFFCIFTFLDHTKNKKVIYEIPYPFSIDSEKNKLTFNYTLETFCEKNVDFQNKVQTFQFKKVSKFFNKKLIVSSDI
jgi:hypothetical protein